jgi:hypothetical protein
MGLVPDSTLAVGFGLSRVLSDAVKYVYSVLRLI